MECNYVLRYSIIGVRIFKNSFTVLTLSIRNYYFLRIYSNHKLIVQLILSIVLYAFRYIFLEEYNIFRLRKMKFGVVITAGINCDIIQERLLSSVIVAQNFTLQIWI